MKINIVANLEELRLGINEINELLGIELEEGGVELKVEKLDDASENFIEIQGGFQNIVRYKKTNDFFRALGLFVQLKEKSNDDFELKENKLIPECGVMLDVSRNAVYRVSTVKNIIKKLALMGHNRFMLYAEDTYEVEGYPYFGYLRGRYSKEELKAIDDYAYSFGIEVIPCIQTLAHLKEALKWQFANEMKDTQDILLVGEEKTYEFIEAMISSVCETFRSRNIHIGMDEAKDLGRGSYIKKNGYKPATELMTEHLNRVYKITEKYGLKPMMWDDMFFRAAAVNSPNVENGDYYDLNVEVSEELAKSVPENLGLVYWDYYHDEEFYYDRLLQIREGFNNEIIFAGGTWKWMGFTPHYEKTFITTNAALKQCKEKGIKQVFATAWGDDGAEAPLDCILLGLILFSEHAYNREVSDEWLEERCSFLTKLSIADFKALEELDLIPGITKPNLNTLNPSKYLLYQDILLGAFDKHIGEIDVVKHYTDLSEKYIEIGKKNSEYTLMFYLYSRLSLVLSVKAGIGVRLRNAYLKADIEELQNINTIVLSDLLDKVEEFHDAFRKLWFKECKGHGFEVNDIRLGGVKDRIKTARLRIQQYLDGEIDNIEELEEERLFFIDKAEDECKLIAFNQYTRIASQNVMHW